MRIFVPGGHLKAGMVAAASLLAKDDMMAGTTLRLELVGCNVVKMSDVSRYLMYQKINQPKLVIMDLVRRDSG